MKRFALFLILAICCTGLLGCTEPDPTPSTSPAAYEITFVSDGQVLGVVSAAAAPSFAPTRDGYALDGWYFDEQLSQPANLADLAQGGADARVYAKWNAVFTIEDGVITGLTESGKMQEQLTIPAQIDGTAITAVGNNAFKNNNVATSVIIQPDGITTIGEMAFSGMKKLSSVSIGDGVLTIGANAFSNNSALLEIDVPDSVMEIGRYAFYFCINMQRASVGDGVVSLGKGVFHGCSKMTEAVIGSSVREIGADLFRDCAKLEKITVPFVGQYKNGSGATHIGYLFGATDYTGNRTSIKALKEVVLTAATAVYQNAFYNCDGLSSIVLPEGLTKIGGCAFRGCTSLESISLPTTTTLVEYSAFSLCTSLADVRLNEGLITISSYAFYGCTALEQIAVPRTVEEVGRYCFKACTGLQNVSMGRTDGWTTGGAPVSESLLQTPTAAAAAFKNELIKKGIVRN